MLYVRNRSVTHVHCVSITFLFPVYSTGKTTYWLFRILDNSDNLNSVHCLYLLFEYMYLVFFICFVFRGHMIEWLSCQMYHPLEIMYKWQKKLIQLIEHTSQLSQLIELTVQLIELILYFSNSPTTYPSNRTYSHLIKLTTQLTQLIEVILMLSNSSTYSSLKLQLNSSNSTNLSNSFEFNLPNSSNSSNLYIYIYIRGDKVNQLSQ